jgi:hypothetical protein
MAAGGEIRGTAGLFPGERLVPWYDASAGDPVRRTEASPDA